MENNELNNDWRLQKIELEFQTYGDHKGNYLGKIKFQNGDYESFEFKIRPEMSQSYIDLIGEEIAKHAESLGSRLKDSLNLK